MQNKIPKLSKSLPLIKVALFGSYAKGKFTAFSDIDLLVIYGDPPNDDAYKLVRKIIQLQGLEPHVYSKSEYEQVKNIVDLMIKEGILLFDRSTEK